jgi:hypothetical protein
MFKRCRKQRRCDGIITIRRRPLKYARSWYGFYRVVQQKGRKEAKGTRKTIDKKGGALRRLLTNDNLTDGELSNLTPNNICAGQSCGQFHFCRRLDICRQLDSVHAQEYKSNINAQGAYLLIHFLTNYEWIRHH